MIEAVVECTRDGPPPMELRLAWMCGDARLPDPGGVLDQDAHLMHKMSVSVNVYKAIQKLSNSHGPEIHRLTDGERRIIRRLQKMGML